MEHRDLNTTDSFAEQKDSPRLPEGRGFFFGLTPTIEGVPFLSTEKLFSLAGENTGNLALSHALAQTIGNVTETIGWHSESEMLHDPGSIAIMALSNQLGPHADMGDPSGRFAGLGCRMVGIGLGAQAHHLNHEIDVPTGSLEWVRTIQNHATSASPNLSVRGEFTRRLLEKYGLAEKTTVLGCPTLFLSPNRNLGAIVAERFAHTRVGRVAVAAGHPKWLTLGTLEHSLARIVDQTSGVYICQSPFDMVMLGRVEADRLSEAALEECRRHIHPTMSAADFILWTRERALSFFSVPAWMEFLRRFDFVVGTRIHGVILGLQAGIPSLCITHDSRTEELCQTMKIPSVQASDILDGVTIYRLTSLFRFDPDAFDRNRQHLATAYLEFLESNRLCPSAHLRALVGNAVGL